MPALPTALPAALLVFVGGGLGAVLRWLVGRWTWAALGPGFPWGTLAINLLGSFAMGALAAGLIGRDGGVANSTRLFVATGVLGGFTTFSAFSLDALTLWQRGQPGLAATYIAASLAGALAAIALGYSLGPAR